MTTTPISADTERTPNAIDMHVGMRVRLRRRALGLSQDRLAKSLGLTFQQVQKYERGANRVSASKLYEIARTLQVHITFFFEGLANPVDLPPGHLAEPEGAGFVYEMVMTPEGMELAALFPRIDHRHRKLVLDMTRAFLEQEAAETDDDSEPDEPEKSDLQG